MVFLAAMNDIPPEILEASRLDGATRWQQFRMIMFPLMWPSITTISILTFINTFNQFDVVYIMQGLIGNPMYSTDVLGTMFYRLAFGSQGSSGVGDTGMALSIATLMLIFIGAGTLFMLRMMQKRRVNY
jgi:raffinose/stachyose/melibiose transport system permease protein